MLQKLHEKNGSTSEKEEWRRLEGKNPTKWHWEKGSWRWGLAKIEALQNGSGIFICFIKSWMHWFDHFLTKLSKYLWIKTGDRHYHFVEPWVIDRPFCRMETVYWSHFAEKRGGSLQNAPPPTSPIKWQGGFWKYLGSRGFLSYVPSGCRRVDVVGGVLWGLLDWCSVCAISTKHARANMVGYWDGGEIEMS